MGKSRISELLASILFLLSIDAVGRFRNEKKSAGAKRRSLFFRPGSAERRLFFIKKIINKLTFALYKEEQL